MTMYRDYWNCKWLTDSAESIPDMVKVLREEADLLEEMHAAGVSLDEGSVVNDGHADLVTEDPQVAEKYGFSKDEVEGEDEA